MSAETRAETILAEIRARRDELDAHAADQARIRAERDRFIVEAVEAGVAHRVIAAAAGFERHGRVYQIAHAAKDATASTL